MTAAVAAHALRRADGVHERIQVGGERRHPGVGLGLGVLAGGDLSVEMGLRVCREGLLHLRDVDVLLSCDGDERLGLQLGAEFCLGEAEHLRDVRSGDGAAGATIVCGGCTLDGLRGGDVTVVGAAGRRCDECRPVVVAGELGAGESCDAEHGGAGRDDEAACDRDPRETGVGLHGGVPLLWSVTGCLPAGTTFGLVGKK